MDNPFICSPRILGKQWRAARAQLSADKTDLEHLQIVIDFWSNALTSAPFLDWDNPTSWPDPWEFMSEMTFDISAIALGIEYTLLLSEDKRWTSDRLELKLVSLMDHSQQLLVLIVDNTYVLNYNYKMVTPLSKINNMFLVQQCYQYVNKIHMIKE
jgi:hypothetical protein